MNPISHEELKVMYEELGFQEKHVWKAGSLTMWELTSEKAFGPLNLLYDFHRGFSIAPISLDIPMNLETSEDWTVLEKKVRKSREVRELLARALATRRFEESLPHFGTYHVDLSGIAKILCPKPYFQWYLNSFNPYLYPETLDLYAMLMYLKPRIQSGAPITWWARTDDGIRVNANDFKVVFDSPELLAGEKCDPNSSTLTTRL